MNFFSHPVAFEGSPSSHGPRAPGVIPVAAAPAALAVTEIFHPHAGNLLALNVRLWLVVHYLQVPLFALSAFAIARLVRARDDFPARVCRVALFVFALCFVVFDTAAGLVVGSLVESAHASGRPGAWLAPIHAIWTHPILGGTNRPLLAFVGRVALSVGAVAAAVSLRRAGRPWLPLLLLAGSGCVMYVFPSHAWPGGPLTFGGLAMAGAWLQWPRAHALRSQHALWSRDAAARTGWRSAAHGQREAVDGVRRDPQEQRPAGRAPFGAKATAADVTPRPHERGEPGRRSG
ncbi:hypothetical protein [Fulvimonas yonginensis]|uniref:Uncharacterized protein n=1 Tax=Fulvimonas yonginensis TaxID=1495200 RepID=A0ABU8JCE4_9GAMM